MRSDMQAIDNRRGAACVEFVQVRKKRDSENKRKAKREEKAKSR